MNLKPQKRLQSISALNKTPQSLKNLRQRYDSCSSRTHVYYVEMKVSFQSCLFCFLHLQHDLYFLGHELKLVFVLGNVEAIIASYMARSGPLYICKGCEFTGKSHSNLRSHVESKHYSPGYICISCGKEFRTKYSHLRHCKTTKTCALKP